MEMKEKKPCYSEWSSLEMTTWSTVGELKSQHLKQACQWLLWGGMGNDGLRLWLRLGTAAGWRGSEERLRELVNLTGVRTPAC